MNRVYRFFLVLLGSLLVGCNEAQEAPTFDLLISNAQIIDEYGQLWDAPKNIYIKADTISLITANDTIFKTSILREIEAKDLFVLPGFWDNHAHFRGSETLIPQNEKFLSQYLEYGITTVRDAGGDLTAKVQQWNQEIENGTRQGPTIFTSGPKLDGKAARWAGSLEISDQTSLNTALDSLEALKTDYIKLYDSTLSRKWYLESIHAAERRGIITSGHMPFTVELNEAIDAGLDNIEHLYYVLKGCSSQEKEITQQVIDGQLSFWESMSLLIDTYDPTTAKKTFEKLIAQNTTVTPTLHIGHVLSYLDEVDHSQDNYLKELDSAFVATYQGRINSAMNASAKAKKDRKELQQFFIELTKELHAAGVSLLAGSDNGAYNSYVYPGISLHQELEQMVKAGLTPAQALQTSALNGAHFLKKQNYGIKPGAKGDFVILRENPLEDIKNTQSIEKIVKNGQLIH